jgi:hypothetical protein
MYVRKTKELKPEPRSRMRAGLHSSHITDKKTANSREIAIT